MWRVVVADQRSARDGRIIENVGHYNPQTDPSTVVLDRERLDYWIEKGAQPSNTVRKLMRVPDTVAPAVVEEATADAAAEAADAPADVAGATEPDPTADDAPADVPSTEGLAEADPPSEGAGDAENAAPGESADPAENS
jgi:small subunit ribosomal protein S16